MGNTELQKKRKHNRCTTYCRVYIRFVTINLHAVPIKRCRFITCLSDSFLALKSILKRRYIQNPSCAKKYQYGCNRVHCCFSYLILVLLGMMTDVQTRTDKTAATHHAALEAFTISFGDDTVYH